ncbi:hypothetical protein ACMHYB_21150 [Sorangium sp. So ce1128]
MPSSEDETSRGGHGERGGGEQRGGERRGVEAHDLVPRLRQQLLPLAGQDLDCALVFPAWNEADWDVTRVRRMPGSSSRCGDGGDDEELSNLGRVHRCVH